MIELLAVIVVLGLLVGIASVNVNSYVKSSNKETLRIAMDNLNDAAVSYAINKLTITDACAFTTDPTSLDAKMGSCTQNLVTVKTLKDEGYFTDNKDTCGETSQILMYKYHDTTYDTYEIRAFVPSNACEG